MTTHRDEMGPMYALPGTPAPESPNLSFNSALARFEYEAGAEPTQATKVLMVEWEDDERTRALKTGGGQWHISWKDRHSVLPAGDQEAGARESSTPASSLNASAQPPSGIHRMFFLLPPGTAIPPSVQLVFEPKDTSLPHVEYKTNPLPAIFPPELGASAREAGKKGVLHTLWAKKRLAVLQAEIDAEYKNNFEGIGLEMALQEKEWIEVNFGVQAKRSHAPTALKIPSAGEFSAAGAPPSPASPRSPGGGRLLEKLKGLRVGTNERAWAEMGVQTPPQTGPGQINPLSPQTGDVAISSFEAIKGASGGAAAALPARRPEQAHARRITAQAPPADLLKQQESVSFGGLGIGSIVGVTQSEVINHHANDDDEEEEDGLFALPMSPRSPEMSKGPFSFDAKDVERYNVAATN